MAEVDEGPEDRKKADGQKPKKKNKLFLIVVVVIFVAYAWSTFGPDTSAPGTSPSATRSPSAPGAKPSTSEKPSETPAAESGAIDVAGVSREGWVVQFEKRLGTHDKKMGELDTKIDSVKTETLKGISDLRNNMDQQFGRVIEEQTKFIHGQQEAIRRGETLGAPLPPLGAAPGGSAVPSGIQAPGGPNPALAYQASGLGNAVPSQPLARTVDSIPQDARDSVARVADLRVPQPDDKKDAKKPTIDVPASSSVHITNLHGVNCPMSNPSRGNDQQAVPIVLAIKGQFKAPNGHTFDLGNAHLQGKCFGLPSTVNGDRARARIFIDRISFVSPRGKNQFVQVEGFVIDRRDSEQDVLGYYDSKQGAAIAKASTAAAIAAVGELSVSSNYTNTTNPATGSTTSSFTGNVGPTALSAAVAETGRRTATYYQNQAEAMVPFVNVPAKQPLVFETLKPFSIESEESDNVAQLY